jgi:hypothetical protein
LASFISALWAANGVHCSSAAASEAIGEKPAVFELLARVCAARTNSRVTSPGALRQILYSRLSVSRCPRASLR